MLVFGLGYLAGIREDAVVRRGAHPSGGTATVATMPVEISITASAGGERLASTTWRTVLTRSASDPNQPVGDAARMVDRLPLAGGAEGAVRGAPPEEIRGSRGWRSELINGDESPARHFLGWLGINIGIDLRRGTISVDEAIERVISAVSDPAYPGGPREPEDAGVSDPWYIP
ncbi:MAG: hypothetical protein ACRDZW_01460 [Acidimicrobiales bacterium]